MDRIETKTSLICFDPTEGFLRVTTKENCEMELEDAKSDFQMATQLVHNIEIPVLVDGRKMINHSKEVRDFYASEEIAQNIKAMAILVDSLPTRIIGNFFIKTSKPHFPTRLFDKEKSAIKWINEVLLNKDSNIKNAPNKSHKTFEQKI